MTFLIVQLLFPACLCRTNQAILDGMKTVLMYVALVALSFTHHGSHVETPYRATRPVVRRTLEVM
jgi:hypothetical protein